MHELSDMEICTYCNGTGHHGNCEYCGGSGFNPQKPKPVSPATGTSHAKIIAEFRQKAKAESKARPAPEPQTQFPAPQPPRTHPSGMEPSDLICGLSSEQLEIPMNVPGFKLRKIRGQVESIAASMPDVTRIVWPFSINACIAYGGDGKKREFSFGSQKQAPKTRKRIAPPPPIAFAVSSKSKPRPRTIPHPSQVTSPAPGVTAREVKGGLVRVKSKPKASIPKTQNRHGKRPVRDNQFDLPKMEAGPVGPTSLEIAFESARTQKEVDGSKDWAGYRDVDGRFGSYPSFDPSDTPDD